jgi:serine/threonine protein kinase
MAFCKSCGKELDHASKFCNHCGTPAEEKHSGSTEAPDPFKTVVKDSPAYGAVNLEQLPEGHLIDDRYEVRGKLGQGGFGAVYRVFDRKMECEKALKILPEAVASDRAAMVGLKKEAVTMAKLNHPGIVHVYDFCDTGSIKYIDMEFVEGASLSEALVDAPEGRFDEDRVKVLARQLAEGLAYAHTQGVIHKDIKAQNILITKDGTPKITDFGISETVKSSMSRIANSSSSGTLVYMAPEQIRGKDVGRESDIYSFGALLYELLSGHPPFYKGAIEHQILNEAVPTLEGIGSSLNTLVLRCLEKEYTNRYRRFEDVLSALEGKDVASAPGPEGASPSKPEKGKKPLWLAVACIGLLAIAAGVYGLVGGSDAPDETVATVSNPKDISQLPFPEQQALKIAACQKDISRLTTAVTSMKTRMDSGQTGEGDSMKSMLDLIQEKTAKTNALAVLVQEKEGWQRKRLAGDIETYKGLVATEEGKSLQAVAWKELIKKYPERAEGVVAYDTNALLDGCRLYVGTEPEGATVKITNIGPAFFPGMKLKPGRYDISVKSGSYLPKVLAVDLTAGGEKRVKVRLDHLARLTVETMPSNARVILKGVRETYSPGVQLKPGTYRVLVKADEHTPQEREVVLKAGETKEVSISLVSWPRLNVSTTPGNARISIEEVEQVYSPGMRVKPGHYTIVAEADKYERATKSVTLDVDGDNAVHITLNKACDDAFLLMDGVTLGVTTVETLAVMGQRAKNIDDDTGKPYRYYKVNGTNYWYDDGVAESVHITHTGKLPDNLIELGVDFSKSYNEWVDFLKRNGFRLTKADKPKVEIFRGKRCLEAELDGDVRTPSGMTVTFKLDFSYGDGHTVSAKNTLYSIGIKGEKI